MTLRKSVDKALDWDAIDRMIVEHARGLPDHVLAGAARTFGLHAWGVLSRVNDAVEAACVAHFRKRRWFRRPKPAPGEISAEFDRVGAEARRRVREAWIAERVKRGV